MTTATNHPMSADRQGAAVNFPDRWSYVEMNVHELLKIFNNVRSEGREAWRFGWRRPAVVRADGDGGAVRCNRHSHHAGIAGPQMGLRAGDRLHRHVWCLPVRARLPRTATWVARTVYLVALAAGAGVNNALRRGRRRRHPGWRSGRRRAPTQ